MDSLTYEEALEYLRTETVEGIKPDLSRISYICRELGNPQLSYPTIHITGTNGKTTTARMIASILSVMGYKAGVYTSPHLVSYTERMVVGREAIGPKQFAEGISKLTLLFNEASQKCRSGRVTQFEALTVLAFSFFRDEKVDCAIIETGMGGSWDATNTVRAKVALITNVSLEHTDRLGDTTEEITSEKVGIIKAGSTAIAGVQEEKLLSIIDRKCSDKGVPLKIFGQDFDVLKREKNPHGSQVLSIKGLYGQYDGLTLSLTGTYQAKNAALAVAASESFLMEDDSGMRPANWQTSFPSVLAEALGEVKSPGRLEVVGERPRLVLDGAHNPAGSRELAQALKTDFSYGKLILVLSILADKDTQGILKELIPLASLVIASQNKDARALDVAKLAERIRDLPESKGLSLPQGLVVEKDLGRAIEIALARADESDMVLVTGSLYTVGEAKSILRRH